MANNLDAVAPKLLAQGLLALRGATVMPRLVNGDYQNQAAEKGDTIDVPIPSAIQAQAVTPNNVSPSTADVTPTKAAIKLDQWFEAPFYLTDREMMIAMAGTIPMQASEAVKALADNVNTYLLGLYKGIYGFVGTAGTTPFATTTTAATDARKTLNKQLAPMGDRRAVIDPDADGNATALPAFQYVNNSGSNSVMTEGELGRRLGFNWYMDQAVRTHTAGTAAGYLVSQANHAIGDATVNIDTGTGTILEGDIFTVAGDSQTYAVRSFAAGVLTYAPKAARAFADNAAISFRASHVVNLAFHRDAIAFATRPLETLGDGLGNIIQSAADPVSGLTLRLEISREHKRLRFSYDILYGAALIRAELATRIAG
jgi:hypothetical protein